MPNILSTATCACPAPTRTTSLMTGCPDDCKRWSFPPHLQGAGTKSDNDIIAIGREEITVAGAGDARAAGEAAAAQHLAGIKPGLRVVLIAIRSEEHTSEL